MALTHFKISTLPTRVTLNKNASAATLDQPYPIAEESELAIDNQSGLKSEHLDVFGYKVSNDGGTTWSNEGFITIHDYADTNTPQAATIVSQKGEQETFSVETLLGLNSSTDRIQITGFQTSNGLLKLGSELVNVGDEIFIYDLDGLFFSTQNGGGNPYQVVEFKCGNHQGYNETIYTLEVEVLLLATLTLEGRTESHVNEGSFCRSNITDSYKVDLGYIGKPASVGASVSSPMFSQGANNVVVLHGSEYTTDGAKTISLTLDQNGEALFNVTHSYLDENGLDTSSSVSLSLDSVDSDPGKVSATNSASSSVTINGLAQGAAGAVTSYRSEKSGDFIYGGFLDGSTPVIKRKSGGTITTAQGVTDLETDWANKENLTYS